MNNPTFESLSLQTNLSASWYHLCPRSWEDHSSEHLREAQHLVRRPVSTEEKLTEGPIFLGKNTSRLRNPMGNHASTSVKDHSKNSPENGPTGWTSENDEIRSPSSVHLLFTITATPNLWWDHSIEECRRYGFMMSWTFPYAPATGDPDCTLQSLARLDRSQDEPSRLSLLDQVWGPDSIFQQKWQEVWHDRMFFFPNFRMTWRAYCRN